MKCCRRRSTQVRREALPVGPVRLSLPVEGSDGFQWNRRETEECSSPSVWHGQAAFIRFFMFWWVGGTASSEQQSNTHTLLHTLAEGNNRFDSRCSDWGQTNRRCCSALWFSPSSSLQVRELTWLLFTTWNQLIRLEDDCYLTPLWINETKDKYCFYLFSEEFLLLHLTFSHNPL